ncbi:MAG TPA: hypothetical protein VHS31_11940 [Tepidisphaeraceae bacterium]|nr:hypothetical protein [Tepidisphaeraceae bacterium]
MVGHAGGIQAGNSNATVTRLLALLSLPPQSSNKSSAANYPRNIHKEGRGIVEIDPIPAANVQRMFRLSWGVLNFTLNGVSFCYEMIKPFDALAKGLLVSSNRGDRI